MSEAVVMFLMRKDGMTLIELMIALAISVILVGGIYAIFVVQQRSYTVQDQIAAIQQDARAAINIMARDIRMAGMLCAEDPDTSTPPRSNRHNGHWRGRARC